ncbi:hypothetical protein DPMN_015782 [Dreissena polymorpha]|uniref:Uncharacterized protein n=1 Tax=Dreissena polymorpha TaxID=45954 RepID=A0A9D4S6H4_DREPO|nr:hypothetical protein DPMN_015782 [Dreissena polymorpha]
MACCRLHNLCLQNGLPEPPELDLEEDHDQEVDAPDNNLGGQAVGNQFVQESTMHFDDSGCSRENVPLMKTSYRAYCRAYYMLVTNLLTGTIGSGVPTHFYDVRVIRNAVDDSVRDLTISAEDESNSGLEKVQRVYDNLHGGPFRPGSFAYSGLPSPLVGQMLPAVC